MTANACRRASVGALSRPCYARARPCPRGVARPRGRIHVPAEPARPEPVPRSHARRAPRPEARRPAARARSPRPVPKPGRSKSEMNSATSLAAGTSRILRNLSPVADWMAQSPRLESGLARRDFPARRNEFPVPDHRESVAITVEGLRNLGAERARRVQSRRISLYFPCRSGKPTAETSSLQTGSTEKCRDSAGLGVDPGSIRTGDRGFSAWKRLPPTFVSVGNSSGSVSPPIRVVLLIRESDRAGFTAESEESSGSAAVGRVTP